MLVAITPVPLSAEAKSGEGSVNDPRLSGSQAEAIQQVIMRERRDLESLIAQLRTTREKLLATDPERTSDKDIKAVAAWRPHRRIPLTDTPEHQTVYQSLLSRSAGLRYYHLRANLPLNL